jgi:hypothetical protein
MQKKLLDESLRTIMDNRAEEQTDKDETNNSQIEKDGGELAVKKGLVLQGKCVDWNKKHQTHKRDQKVYSERLLGKVKIKFKLRRLWRRLLKQKTEHLNLQEKLPQ